ncbi:helix-turn-helix domain-containing protein [uncultured Actinomyces sp.]|jgi:hypothetical protein|uniref:TetR/AcrR family transcriptional regulator n=1 Tax=uncultured Actinomyces sp. TaxID=249061 RepID=UPI002880A397|nr:helix-turn-helix domain-containing protein [uncultured Actinomyces sp.]
MTSTSGGRRARKKLATRRAIRRTALDLFTARGFDAVTVEQITEAADVSPMTFYRHFGTKQAVVLDIAPTGATIRALDRALPPRSEGVGEPLDIDVALDALLVDADQWLDDLARRVRLVRDSPALQDALWQRTTAWTGVLERRLPGAGLAARARARAMIGVAVEAVLAWGDRRDHPSAACLRECLARALAVIRADPAGPPAGAGTP